VKTKVIKQREIMDSHILIIVLFLSSFDFVKLQFPVTTRRTTTTTRTTTSATTPTTTHKPNILGNKLINSCMKKKQFLVSKNNCFTAKFEPQGSLTLRHTYSSQPYHIIYLKDTYDKLCIDETGRFFMTNNIFVTDINDTYLLEKDNSTSLSLENNGNLLISSENHRIWSLNLNLNCDVLRKKFEQSKSSNVKTIKT
jgi:hypothetical protein